jgi:inorganic pyrophosphatase
MLFAVIIFFAAEPTLGYFYTTAAFLVGGGTSILSGYIGMRIAVYTNVRTTKECAEDISKGFVVAYRGGQVLGFVLVSLALVVLEIVILVWKAIYLKGIDSPTTAEA